MLRSIALGSVAAVALAATSLTAQDAKPVQTSPAKPVFTEDGTVHVPAFDLPPSELSSPQARAAQAMRAKMPGGVPPTNVDISSIRRGLEAMLAPQVGRMREACAGGPVTGRWKLKR